MSITPRFDRIGKDEVPKSISWALDHRGKLYTVDEREELANYDERMYRVCGNEGIVSYIGQADKHLCDDSVERTIQLIDVLGERVVGCGEAALIDPHDSYYRDKPLVMMTNTDSEMRHNGLGRRRILLLGNACIDYFSLPLYSGDQVNHQDVRAIWQRLWREGYAQQFTENILESDTRERVRYVLSANQPTLLEAAIPTV